MFKNHDYSLAQYWECNGAFNNFTYNLLLLLS